MKLRRTYTLDEEVVKRLEDAAHDLWSSDSALVNQTLAERFDLREIANRPIGRKEEKDEDNHNPA